MGSKYKVQAIFEECVNRVQADKKNSKNLKASSAHFPPKRLQFSAPQTMSYATYSKKTEPTKPGSFSKSNKLSANIPCPRKGVQVLKSKAAATTARTGHPISDRLNDSLSELSLDRNN
jgi:hypothetical protein